MRNSNLFITLSQRIKLFMIEFYKTFAAMSLHAEDMEYEIHVKAVTQHSIMNRNQNHF